MEIVYIAGYVIDFFSLMRIGLPVNHQKHGMEKLRIVSMFIIQGNGMMIPVVKSFHSSVVIHVLE